MKQICIEYLEVGIWGAIDEGGDGDVVCDSGSLPSDTLLAFFEYLQERYPADEFEIIYSEAAMLCELIDHPVALLNEDHMHRQGFELFVNSCEEDGGAA